MGENAMKMVQNWIGVGDSMYERFELYSNQLVSTFEKFIPAPNGGPILVTYDNLIGIHAASGAEIAKWKWRTGGKIITIGWSLDQELVFVIEDGTILVYSIYGELIKTTSMGQEAKDVKIRDAQVFRSRHATGVAVLTTSNRFFVVNNIKDARPRRLTDIPELPHTKEKTGRPSWPWLVLPTERQAKICFSIYGQELQVLSLSDIVKLPLPDSSLGVSQRMVLSPDLSKIAVLDTVGVLWIGRLSPDVKALYNIVQLKIEDNLSINEIAWCGSNAVLAFAPESSQCLIISADHISPTFVKEFFMGFIAVISELDSARVYSQTCQEMFRKLPDKLVGIFAFGSVSPGAKLRLAREEFDNKSHRADEYIRSLDDNLNIAVDDCLEAAGMVHDSNVQKSLMTAAQFGKAFSGVNALSSTESSEKFSEMCKNLRVLNAIRDYKIGMPLTMQQYQHLSPLVVIDRLLQRRLFPLASKICQFLQIQNGHSRVLAHWACYKVSQMDLDDDEIAKAIKKRFRDDKADDISYCDIAGKAAECGKTKLAIELLESETSVQRQVPLLIKLKQEPRALDKALKSGDRDLAFSVILHLRKSFSSSDFHMLIRKYGLGKVLYESFLASYPPDSDSLLDWYVQEDDYSSQALYQIERSMAATRTETRQAILVNVQELFKKAKAEPLVALAEDHHRLLKAQNGLEEKLGKNFVGLTLHQTLSDLIQYDEFKLAEKLKQDFKLSERRFTWLKLTTWARTHQWNELKRYSKGKKLPISVMQVVKLAKQHGGQEAANEFLTEEYLNNEDRYTLLREFGMYVEAASAAFAWKNMEALTHLEALCSGRDEILKSIQGYKAKLLGSAK